HPARRLGPLLERAGLTAPTWRATSHHLANWRPPPKPARGSDEEVSEDRHREGGKCSSDRSRPDLGGVRHGQTLTHGSTFPRGERKSSSCGGDRRSVTSLMITTY